MRARCGTLLLGVASALLGLCGSAVAAGVCATPVAGPPLERVRAVIGLGNAGWLIDARKGAFHLDAEAARLTPLDGVLGGTVADVLQAGPDSWILLSNTAGASPGGVFRLNMKELTLRELSGSEPLKVAAAGRLANGGFLLGTPKGLLRVEGGQQVRETGRPATGAVSLLQPLDDGSWLIGAQAGLYRSDPRGTRIDPVPGADTGAVSGLSKLADGTWLIGGERGLFRADAAARALAPLPARKPGRVLEIHRMADGASLVRSEAGLLVVDADGRKSDTISEEPGSTWKIVTADATGVLLGSERLLYAYQPASKRLELISGETGTEVFSTHEVPGGWLISSRRGLFRLEHPRFKVTAVKGPILGRIHDLQPLGAGGFLIRTGSGLFRLDPAVQNLERIAGPDPGQILAFVALKDGSALVGAERGLFRVDAEARQALPVEGSSLSDISALYSLRSGEWLAIGEDGAASVDASGQRASAIPGLGAGALLSVQPLPAGGALLASRKALFTLSGGLDGAKVSVGTSTWLDSTWWPAASAATTWTLTHACAAAAPHLGLSLQARSTETPDAAPRMLPIKWLETSGDAARFTADLSRLEPGRWSLRLAANAGGQVSVFGEPVALDYRETLLDRVRQHALLLAAAAAAVHILIVGGLFLSARRNARLLKVLRHPLWSKLAIWPSFLVRSSAKARHSVLQPWFKTNQSAISPESPFFDIEATGPDGAALGASKLLSRAKETPRIWLHGRPGMGKTEVLAHWQRAFFSARNLKEAVHRFGFVLVPVSLEGVPGTPDGTAPGSEAVLEEAVRQSFVRAGLPADPGFIRILLRKAELVLAFDRIREAERDGPIAAFTRAYPAARLLVVSDVQAPAGWETWHLPATPDRNETEALLRLWLGSYSGSRLATRVAREGLEPHLVSAFDVRLVADLVTSDPDKPLPPGRSGLYQALLERAIAAGATHDDIGKLKSLAWAMTLDGRRDLRPEESEGLSPASLTALSGARVLEKAEHAHNFAHDLLRLFLAASWLVEHRREPRALARELQGSRIWGCSRPEQEELWRFVVELLTTEDISALWPFALESTDRVYLIAALYARGRATNLFPLGLNAAVNSPVTTLVRRRAARPMLSAPSAS